MAWMKKGKKAEPEQKPEVVSGNLNGEMDMAEIPQAPEAPKLTAEQEAAVEFYRWFHAKYGLMHNATELATTPEAVYRAEVLNILMAILGEVKKLNEVQS